MIQRVCIAGRFVKPEVQRNELDAGNSLTAELRVELQQSLLVYQRGGRNFEQCCRGLNHVEYGR